MYTISICIHMSVIVYGKRAIVTLFYWVVRYFLHGMNIFNVIFPIVRLFSHSIILRCDFLSSFVCMCVRARVCVLAFYI